MNVQGRDIFAVATRRAMLAAAVLAALTLAAGPASAQDQRQRLTQRIQELTLQLEKSVNAAEKTDLEDQLEACRHELGRNDANGQKLTWTVSYPKTLCDALSAQITELEGQGKGGWGLVPLGDDVRRAWRILARTILDRAENEGDAGERERYALAGMTLVHNAELIDAAAAELTKIEAARKATPEGPEHAYRRSMLDRGLNGGRGVIGLCRRVIGGQAQMGHGEIRELSNRLEQMRSSAEYLKNQPEPGGAAPPADNSAVEALLKRADELSARIGKLKGASDAVKARLAKYVEMVRFGVGEDVARPMASELLGNLERAATLWESLSASEFAPESYVTSRQKQLADALALIDDRDARGQAYGRVFDLERRDLPRRRLEGTPLARTVRESLLRGYEWAEDAARTAANDEARRTPDKIQFVVNHISWKCEQLFGDPKPADRYLLTAYRNGLKELDAKMAQLVPLVVAHNPDAERVLWEADGLVNEIRSVVQTDLAIAALEPLSPVTDTVRKVCGTLAMQLFDTDPNNDNEARNRLREGRDAIDLVRAFREASLGRAEVAEAATLTRGKYYPLFRAQAGRDMQVVAQALAGSFDDRNQLRQILPAYRLMAEWGILKRAAESGELDRLRAARWLTMPSAAVDQVRQGQAETLKGLFDELARVRREDLDRVIDPVRSTERLLRTAAAALMELKRRNPAQDRWADLVDNLRRAAFDDPGQDARNRWRVSWHLNQALEARSRGYHRTSEFHVGQMQGGNPLASVPLVTKEEQN
jgi:hypothetical protein